MSCVLVFIRNLAVSVSIRSKHGASKLSAESDEIYRYKEVGSFDFVCPAVISRNYCKESSHCHCWQCIAIEGPDV
ncbi:hypothetical protein OIU85_013350 [Salix viminalis]|uniref:Uncharacterized protein n=1 Tax=Salix viminalis TaxID=40686 RepID=A0A9Q0NLM7_SALVM|nr:hypothetical protein OIU85_013350 [Salix viminalis]